MIQFLEQVEYRSANSGSASRRRGMLKKRQKPESLPVLTDDVVAITVFNRGITLFTTDDDRVVRMQRVLCKLYDARGFLF